MNLLLYKDGRLVIADAGKPLEGNNTDLSNLFAYVTDPQDGDSIVYDSTARVWKTGSGGVSNLTGLTDVNLSNPTDGQTLVYDATAGKWVNGAGGGTPVMRINAVIDWSGETPTATVDKTFAEIKAHLDGGGLCFLVDDGYYTYTLNEVTWSGDHMDSFGFGFVQIYNSNGDTLGMTIYISDDGTVTVRDVYQP